MATTKYEVTYIIKPDVDEDNKKARRKLRQGYR